MLTEFAERFMRLRQDRGYTQQKIAEKLGVTPQAVSKWENGTSLPDAEMIRAIARLMDCSTDYLLNHQASASSRMDLDSTQRQTEIEGKIQKDILTLEVGIGLVDMLVEEGKNNFTKIHDLRMQLGDQMGIMIPTIRMWDNVALGEKEYQILLHGKKIIGQGCLEYPDMDCIIVHLSEVILHHYDEILNRQLTADLVELVRRRYPAAVEGVVPQQVSLGVLQRILAGLVTSGVPVNRLDYIIGYLEEHPQTADTDQNTVIETLRHQLS